MDLSIFNIKYTWEVTGEKMDTPKKHRELIACMLSNGGRGGEVVHLGERK